jgi:translation initiation factor 2 subunit 2
MAEAEAPAFDPTMKKKKKKKVTIDVESERTEDASASVAAVAAEDLADDTAPAHDPSLPAPAGDFSDIFGGKKKAKKAKVPKAAGADGADSGVMSSVDGNKPVAGSDLSDYPDWPDHTYDELLQRVYDIISLKNPNQGEKKRFKMAPPNAVRVGSRKTGLTNFVDLCRTLKRPAKHVMQFLLAELGTSGSPDGNNHLIIKGRFQQKHFEAVLRKYIKEYVTCHTCKSPETEMQKNDRIHFLQCSSCGSRCSVSAIKAGFQAVTGKRAAIRAAAGN